MSSLLINALKCRNSGRPPVWFMRQAGRYLPEYRALRAKYSFLELCHIPELIEEVTVMPINKLGFDAAILFSDILLIPEALGMKLQFTDAVGPVFENPLNSTKDVEDLKNVNMKEALHFVTEGIGRLTKSLTVPLIGFTGAPFTLASYIIEGKSSRDFKKTKRWMLQEPKSFHLLLEKLTDAIIQTLNMQIDAGVQALQIFDSWAWILSDYHFREYSLKYLRKILAGLKNREVPFIYFCRGSSVFAPVIAEERPEAISVDWNANLKTLRQTLPKGIALQGNLDPDTLHAPKNQLKKYVLNLLDQMEGDTGYVFNLGHGIHPDTPVDAVQCVIETIKNYQASNSYKNEN